MGFLCNKQKSVSIPSGTERAAVRRGTGQGDTGTRAMALGTGQAAAEAIERHSEHGCLRRQTAT